MPLWGGVSEAGFAIVTTHKNKKLNAEDFVKVVRKGKLTSAIKAVGPTRPVGPWRVLCDNESFLKKARATHTTLREYDISLWHVPARSPDLNPVEKFWAWLRRPCASWTCRT